MKLPIYQEEWPIGRKCEHWASFLGIRNRLSNARKNSRPGGYLLVRRRNLFEAEIDIFYLVPMSSQTFCLSGWSKDLLVTKGTTHKLRMDY